jgi:hypothetical protein
MSLQAPDLCDDARTWASEGFRQLPADTGKFTRRLRTSVSGPGEVPWQLLLPYLKKNEAKATMLKRLEASLEQTEAKQVAKAVRQLGEALGYRPQT